MPQSQIANQSNYDLHAPAGGSANEKTVAKFNVLKGGRLGIRFDNPSDEDITVTLRLYDSPAAAYEDSAVVADAVIDAKTFEDYDVPVAAGHITKLAVLAYSTNGGRFQMQVRGTDLLEIDAINCEDAAV